MDWEKDSGYNNQVPHFLSWQKFPVLTKQFFCANRAFVFPWHCDYKSQAKKYFLTVPSSRFYKDICWKKIITSSMKFFASFLIPFVIRQMTPFRAPARIHYLPQSMRLKSILWKAINLVYQELSVGKRKLVM